MTLIQWFWKLKLSVRVKYLKSRESHNKQANRPISMISETNCGQVKGLCGLVFFPIIAHATSRSASFWVGSFCGLPSVALAILVGLLIGFAIVHINSFGFEQFFSVGVDILLLLLWNFSLFLRLTLLFWVQVPIFQDTPSAPRYSISTTLQAYWSLECMGDTTL